MIFNLIEVKYANGKWNFLLLHSTPSPHRTPPPQRQGVIQRHNTGGSKPPSPAPNRLHIIPQHHYTIPGENNTRIY